MPTLEHAAKLPSIIARPRPRRRTRVAPFAVAGGALALVVATHLIDLGADNLRIRALDASYEWSWSHIAATAAFGAGAVICGVGWRHARSKRRAWLAASALFGLLCIDTITRFHTHLTAWPVIYAPLLGGLFYAIVAVSWDTDFAPAVIAGVGLLGLSLAIHVFGHELVRAAGWGAGSWPYEIKVALKEGTELAGWVLVVPALGGLALRGRRDRSA
jgi:hypothetical protein